MNSDQVREDIRKYIVETFTKDSDNPIQDNTPLISGGIIDSISTLKMVEFLEGKFNIEFEPHDVDRDNLDTIELITQFVISKMQ